MVASVEQPGYDHVAEQYARAFSEPYLTALERHAVAAFAEMVAHIDVPGRVADLGCGTGHITADLAEYGFDVVGVDPSEAMLNIARRSHPNVEFHHGTALLHPLYRSSGNSDLTGLLARFSIIHVDPADVPAVLTSWADRVRAAGIVLLAFQCTDGDEPVAPFNHAVAPAWRWSPDRMSAELARAGFGECWRTVSRPDRSHRFPECHLAARRRP